MIMRKNPFKKMQFVIGQHTITLDVLLLEKEARITMQWSHIKTFELIYYCLTLIFLFCFCETNFDVFTIFSKLLDLIKNVFFHGNIICNYYVEKKRRKKLSLNILQKGHIFPIFNYICTLRNIALI